MAVDYVKKVEAHQETRLWDHMAGEVLDWLPRLQGERVLDWGCGTGKMSRKMAQMGAEVMGVDPNPTMLLRAFELGGGPRYSLMSPFDMEDETYDDVVAMNVLGHTPSPFQTIQRMAGVLRNNGLLIVLNPNVWHWLARMPSNLLRGYRSDPTILHRFTRNRMIGWAMSNDLVVQQTKFLGEEYMGIPSMHLTRFIKVKGFYD